MAHGGEVARGLGQAPHNTPGCQAFPSEARELGSGFHGADIMSAAAGKFEVAQTLESPRGLVELQKAGPHPQSSGFSRARLGPANSHF